MSRRGRNFTNSHWAQCVHLDRLVQHLTTVAEAVDYVPARGVTDCVGVLVRQAL